MQRFFIKDALSGKKEATIFDEIISHQLQKVMRFSAGDKIILLDNTGFEYLSEISLLSKDQLKIKILEEKQNQNIPKGKVWLFQSLIKKDNFEWIVEKGTEIGISHFVPIVSERSEKKNLNLERLEKIAKEASEQSGRGMLPMIHSVTNIESVFSQKSDFWEKSGANFIAFDPTGDVFEAKKLIPESYKLLIGPEGGWSPKELEFFKSKNIPIYSTGPQILRAETAAIVISSKFLI